MQATQGTPPVVMSLAHYIAIDFFALAHATGLYNRQIKLWEGLARTLTVEISQMSKGIFSQEKLPEYDFCFQDHKKRTVALAYYAAAKNSGSNFDYLKSTNNCLRRAAEVQGASGVFLCYPSPFPTKVLEFIRRETNAADSISRYESIFPKLGVPVNLLEVENSSVFNPSEQAQFQRIRLIHPDLSKKKLGANNLAVTDMSSLDDTNE